MKKTLAYSSCLYLILSFALQFKSFARPKIDPIRFELSTDAGNITLNEEFEIKITAKFITLNPNLIYVFEGSNSFNLKLVTPDGFTQTGGDFKNYVGTELNASKSKISYTIKGKFTSPSKDGTFMLLRSHKNANEQSDFIMVGQLKFSTFEPTADSTANQTARLAAITQEYIPYMNLSKFRAGGADSSKVIYINEGGKSGIFRRDSTDNSSVDDNSMILVYSGKRYKRFFEHVTPEMFGAVRDGVTNDAAAIQKALDFVTITKGLKVIFSAGTYLVGSTLKLKTTNGFPTFNYNIMLLGSGLGTTEIKGTSSISGNLLEMTAGDTAYAGKNSRVIIRDISFTAENADRCFYADFVSQLRLEDCRFNGGQQYTVQIGSDALTRNYSTYITRCYFGGWTTSGGLNKGTLLLKHSMFVAIDQMETDGGRIGVHLNNTAASIISNSKIEGCKYATIFVDGTVTGEHRIANNYLLSYAGYDPEGQFTGEINGIYIQSSGSGSNTTNSIVGNILRVDPTASLPVSIFYNSPTGTLSPSLNSKIVTGQTSGATGYLQTYLPAQSRVLIKMITGTFQDNEILQQATSLATIHVDSIVTNKSYGIRLEGVNGSNNVSANHLINTTDYGIYSVSPGNMIIGNTIAGKTGIYINTTGNLIGNKLFCPGGTPINNVGALANQLDNVINGSELNLGADADNVFSKSIQTVGGHVMNANFGTGNKYVNNIKVNGTEVFSLSNFGPTSSSLVGQNGASVWLGTSTTVDRNARTLGVDGNKVYIKDIPTSASGLASGALWRDAANGNVIKIVP